MGVSNPVPFLSRSVAGREGGLLEPSRCKSQSESGVRPRPADNVKENSILFIFFLFIMILLLLVSVGRGHMVVGRTGIHIQVVSRLLPSRAQRILSTIGTVWINHMRDSPYVAMGLPMILLLDFMWIGMLGVLLRDP